MIEFELCSAWDGWEMSWLPDNLTVECRTADESRKYNASLRNICEMYGYAHHQKSGGDFFGTGGRFKISENDSGGITFKFGAQVTQTTYRELAEELESLMRAVFREQDRINAEDSDRDERREKALAEMTDKVSRYGVAFDVEQCYREYASSERD